MRRPLFLLLALIAGCAHPRRTGPLAPAEAVRGWTILSDSLPEDLAVIAAARRYDINHLELSHEVIMDLKDVRDARKQRLAATLADAAHRAGIREVVVWDHALYDLDYYPKQFRTGPNGTLDLDDPAFWAWLKQDYRDLLDRLPQADGLVLTFIETGARAERQRSAKLKTPQEKLAAVVNAVADVVIGERHLTLYARTFAYTHAEYDNIVGAVDLFRPGVRLLMKETPHDFFLTHPNDFFAGRLARPTVMEFDVAGEFNGQGLIANTWPQYVLGRWRDFARRPHVVGYTARTDRYGATRLIGRPSEVNLWALKRAVEAPDVSAEQVTDEFITGRYGAASLPQVRAAFANAFDVVTSTLYTLGTNVASHSALDYDPYNSSWARHVSGKWIEPPVAHVAHGVNRDLHYWTDVVDHLAPAWAKTDRGAQWDEVPWVKKNGWVTPGDHMDATFLGYVRAEKDYGVAKARASLAHVDSARAALADSDWRDLHAYFERTLLTARLHRAVSTAYFGYRVWARGGEHRTPEVTAAVRDALGELEEVAAAIKAYPLKPPPGQWSWVEDADTALRYRDWITKGWPKETRGVPNPYGGLAFPVR
jgi:hypothetical protein